MRWLASASMPTTRPCRCSPRVRRARAGCGWWCAMTAPSAAPIRRWRSTSTRPIGAASIRSASWRTTQASCRPTYSGFGQLYEPGRPAGAILEAACWAHARRAFFKIAELTKAPMAVEAVERIDALFAIEREINGSPPQVRLAVRNERSRLVVADLERWMRACRAKLSGKSAMAKAFDYLLRRWPSFTRFLDDGRVCLSNNAAERAIRPIAVGRRNWTFAGSDTGGHRAAAMYTLIETCRMNDVDPRAWLSDVIARLPGHPAKRIDELLPWSWKAA